MKKTLTLAAAVLLMAACGTKRQETMNTTENDRTFLDLAEARYSVRKYARTPVEQEKIDAILRAAQLAPTAKNLQPQYIYVLNTPEAIAKVNEVTSRAYKAPVVFVVCYDRNAAWQNPLNNNHSTGEMDVTIVGTHMMLEAAEQGLGSCWIEWFDPKVLAEAFDIPDNLQPAFLLDCGYPADGVQPSPMHFEKKEISQFVEYK